jgi:hypothetical protein
MMPGTASAGEPIGSSGLTLRTHVASDLGSCRVDLVVSQA